MTKIIPVGFLFFLLIACNQNPQCGDKPATPNEKISGQAEENPTASVCPVGPVPGPVPDPDPVPGDDVPNEALIFDVNAQLFKFERADEDKVHAAFEVIKKVVASNEFRDRVLNFTYQGKKQFIDNEGKTNAQIYQILLDGREDLVPLVDSEMDLELELYYSSRNTVGYTTPGAMRIYMNTKFFDSYTPAQVAGNVFHEWLHKLGFDHASSYSVSRDASVPYAIGYIMDELGKKYQ